MPKLAYRAYRPKGPTMAVIEQVDEILQEYAEDGYQLTVRQLYYVFISRDLFPAGWIDPEYNRKQGLAVDTKNTLKNYNKLKSLCTAAREGGYLDWGHITDRGRRLESHPHWQDPERFLNSVCPQFKLDLWLGQPRRVEVWVEKDALSEVIARACEPLDVPYFACKGYASASSVWEAARGRFLQRYSSQGQSITVLHLSDHDPSGLDMTRDLEDRLRLFSTNVDGRLSGLPMTSDIKVRRLALTREQVDTHNPPANPAKDTDPRAQTYKREYGEDSWELDALMAVGPGVLVDMITEAINEEMEDPDLFEERQALQTEALVQLRQISDEYVSVMGHLGLDHLDCGDDPF